MTEAVIRDDFRSAEVLELGGIRAGFSGKMYEQQRPLQAAVMVGSDVCDEPGGVIVSDVSSD